VIGVYRVSVTLASRILDLTPLHHMSQRLVRDDLLSSNAAGSRGTVGVVSLGKARA
jgi:hypothetical protein